MASPGTMALIGMGTSAVSGILGAKGAATNAQAQQVNIQGQMMSAIGSAMQMDTTARGYDYTANIDKYQAAVADMNANISKQNAEYATTVGEVEAQQVGMKHAAEQHSFEASRGASGIDVNSGSATRVRQSMIELSYYDQEQTRATAAKTAYGYEVEATMNKAQADVYRYTALQNEDQAASTRAAADYTRSTATTLGGQAMSLASSAGTTGVLGSLVGAVGSVAGKWMDYQKNFGNS